MLFADKLKELREKKQLLQRQLASALEIDTPMYSRIERGERKAKREQVILLAKLLGANEKDFLQLWLADKVYDVLAEEDCAVGVINMVAENIREYGK
ncbi:MAG: helix-turn-helix transcriptional regulator [Prevotella sp.]|nr:helix-turn-helix transcriptional regulator [Prevotella sp.]